MLDFTGRTCAITGATGGIPAAVARLFARLGADLALADLDAGRLESLAGELRELGADCLVHAHDVRDPAAVADFAQACRTRFGGADHLVTGAGIYRGRSVAAMSEAEWEETLAVNLDGVFHSCRAFLPLLRDGGSIVNLSSMAAHRGSRDHAHYSAAKGAVLSFTRSLALEAAPRLRVNAVSPGLIDTPMIGELLQARGPVLLEATPLGRLGTPEEVAGAVVFLCSPLAAFVTGETLHVNGGLHISG